MRWAQIAAAAAMTVAAVPVTAAEAAASSPDHRTAGSLCERAFGSMSDLPAVPYGDRFMAAAGQGNGFALGCLGDYPVVRAMRAQGLTGAAWTWQSSESGFGYTYSTYRDAQGRSLEIAILLGDREPGGWHAVDGVRAQGSRGALSRYADRMLAAWRAGERDTMERLARPGAVATLSGSPGADSAWRQLATRFGDGQTWVDYADPAGSILSVRIDQSAALAGRSNGVVQVVLGQRGLP